MSPSGPTDAGSRDRSIDETHDRSTDVEGRDRLVGAEIHGRLLDALGGDDAAALVHAGHPREPTLRYLLGAADRRPAGEVGVVRAVAVDEEGILAFAADGDDHPATRLADALRERGRTGTLLAPPDIPHDAALYLERAGFELASTDLLDRLRASKSPAEVRRIERSAAAATAGLRRAASILADAASDGVSDDATGDGVSDDAAGDGSSAGATAHDGTLVVDSEPLGREGFRRRIDAAIVDAGGFPAGHTVVGVGRTPTSDASETIGEGATAGGGADVLPVGESIVVSVAPRGPEGYHAPMSRTFVVDGDGGERRRAHVAATAALRSAEALLESGEDRAGVVEADLAAEVAAFGFEAGVESSVRGVGLEPTERPLAGGTIPDGAVLALEAETIEPAVRLADLLVVEGGAVRRLEAPSRSLVPSRE